MVLENIKVINLLDDIECLDEVSEWIFEEWEKKFNRNLEYIIYRSKHSLNRVYIPQMYIAKYVDVVVGCVSIWRCDLKSRQDLYPWMAALFVKKEYRNQGIGKLLQEKVIEETRKMNYKNIYLITEHENYYERTGWEFIEKAPLEDGSYTKIYKYDLTR